MPIPPVSAAAEPVARQLGRIVRPMAERTSDAVISSEDYLQFVHEALTGMVGIVTDLGDERANRCPDLPAANSPFAILTHCLGVMEYWAGHVVAGRAIQRDREAEFRAAGRIDDLRDRVSAQWTRFVDDVAHADPFAPPRGDVSPDDATLPLGRTQGGALLHVYEELAQHRGQLEVTADMLRG
jgi:uncharacterized damage-inducible protein DinB